MAHQFLKARSQPKRKSIEAKEVTEIQLSSTKKIIVASGKKSESSRKQHEEVGPFGRSSSKKLDEEVLEDLDREVARLDEEGVGPLSVAADDEADSQDQLFAPLQNRRRPKRRNKKPAAQSATLEKGEDDGAGQPVLNISSRSRRSSQNAQDSLNEISKNEFEQFTVNKQSKNASQAPAGGKYRIRSRQRGRDQLNSSATADQVPPFSAGDPAQKANDENTNALNISATSAQVATKRSQRSRRRALQHSFQ